MSRSLKSHIMLGALAAAALVATPASAAVTIGGSGAGTTLTTSGASGGSGVLDFNGFSDGGLIAGLTAKLTLTFLNVVGNTYNFSYAIDNTSSSPVTASRISGFGFDVDPTLTGASVFGSYNTAGAGNVPNGVGVVDFCAKDGGGTNNCAGGGNGGVDLGASGSGTFALTFGSATSAVSLSNLFVRYQSLAGAGGATSASGQVNSPVPEPAAWMLMILGFAGIGFAMRKQRYTQTARVRFV